MQSDDPTSPDSVPQGLCRQSLEIAFPFYLAFDEALRIQQVGPALYRVAPELAFGTSLPAALELISPDVELTAESLRAHPRARISFALRESQLHLEGQVLHSSEQQRFVFVGVPRLSSLAELWELGLTAGDFAAHDRGLETLRANPADDGGGSGPSLLAALQAAENDRRDLEDLLRHQSLHDPLTGLPNRVLLRQRLEDAVRSLAHGGPLRFVALLLIDLEDFKSVNDLLGEAVGDEIIRQSASRMRGSLRPGDCAARFGGDEFAVLLDDLGQPSQALEIALRLQQRIAQPVSVEEHELRTKARIGVAVTSGGHTASTLMQQADLALSRARESVEGHPELFDEAMQFEASERLTLKHDLESALERDEFVLHYHPIVRLDTLEIAGVEALVRWRHPRHGLIGPDRFIELAEESGTILRLGRHILGLACGQGAEWDRLLPERHALAVSVNLSAHQLRHASIDDDVVRSLARSGFPARRLILEITESQVVSRVDEAVETLDRLRNLGTRIALDDFGTGYSSLAYLERLPIDILKIDKSFVDPLAKERPAPLTEAVLGIGGLLDLEVIAEGVEQQRQAECLRELACTQAQGFLFTPPVEAETLTAWIAASAPHRPRIDLKQLPSPRAAER